MRCINDRLRVLISGAASGVGLACAEAFAARGAELVLVRPRRNRADACGRAAGRLRPLLRFDRGTLALRSSPRRSPAVFRASMSSSTPPAAATCGRLAMMRVTRARAAAAARRPRPPLRVQRRRRSTDSPPQTASSLMPARSPHSSGSSEALGRAGARHGDRRRQLHPAACARPSSRNRAPADQLCRLQRVDEQHSARADRATWSSAQRPGCHHRPPLDQPARLERFGGRTGALPSNGQP